MSVGHLVASGSGGETITERRGILSPGVKTAADEPRLEGWEPNRIMVENCLC